MKTNPVCARQGVALVAVLAVMVLAIGILVAFLSLARTERSAASAYLSNAATRQMADNAVGIVQAQINLATTRGAGIAWASQPGMIRTYTTAGALDTAYKLYSAGTLTESSAARLDDDLPSAGWDGSPAVWTDLNAPVRVSGTSFYPILDAQILATGSDSRPKGFSVAATAPVATGTGANPVPMPVRWLYVLKRGEVVAATGSGSSAAVAGASADNPIVGRIAFWTDDETAKVNVNTAGVGSYWDTPHFSTVEDYKFANSQPLNGEFQRYPGHLAMTSLRAVFPQLTERQILETVTPRYQWGGSEQGTVDTFKMTAALNNGTVADKPLYSSVEETLFAASRSARSANPSLNRKDVEAGRFFLTSSSRAPELNLFDLPRVAIWPEAATASARTPFDEVIAFSSTIGGLPYFFQRGNPLNPAGDTALARNTQIFSYLKTLTSETVPGFGVDLATKFGTDRDQILTEIWDYIRSTNLSDTRLASGQFTSGDGYGYVTPLQMGTGTAATQGFGRAITVSELAFLFLCAADPVDTQNAPPNPKGLLGSNDTATNPGLGGVALNLNERRIQLMLLPEFFSVAQGNIRMFPKNLRFTISGLSTLKLGGQSLFAADSGSIRTNGEVEFNPNGTHFRKLGGPLDYRAIAANRGGPSESFAYPFISQFVTVPVANPGTPNPGSMTFEAGTLRILIESSPDNTNWSTLQEIVIQPPVSSAVPVPNLVRVGTTIPTSGPTTASQWWAFKRAGGRLANLTSDTGVYSFSAGVPVPRLPSPLTGRGTLIREPESTAYYTDVVRSMVSAHGDLRLHAGLRTVPAASFAPLGDWAATGPANALMHTLGLGHQNPEYVPGGSQFRRHFVTASPIYGGTGAGAGGYGAPDFATVPAAVLNVVATSGDFDNAMAWWPDGPFINKPDEGNVYTDGTSTPYFRNAQEEIQSVGFFSPNRMIPGPGMFGSLPTHLKRFAENPSRPELFAWRTVLFRKQPNHPNAVTVSSGGLPTSAPDHLLMDLFWMPAVEPYAISEPFSTAGKVNMNYQIRPFTYLTRRTGLHAVLENEKITAVPTTSNAVYKMTASSGAPTTPSYRQNIDISETLTQFDARFADASGRLFLSPTELCDLWLVPQGATLAGMGTFWSGYQLTGDNMRERPYTTIIPRLTTKSNTYTVHLRVQTLARTPGRMTAAPLEFDTAKGDKITGEHRGSSTLERYVDPNEPGLPDFADAATFNDPSTDIDSYYKFRIIGSKKFTP